MRLQLLLSIILIQVLSQKGFSQDEGNSKSSNDSINLYIKAIEKVTRHPLNGVAILNSKGDTIVLSDEKGEAVGRVFILHTKLRNFWILVGCTIFS